MQDTLKKRKVRKACKKMKARKARKKMKARKAHKKEGHVRSKGREARTHVTT